MNSAVRSRWRVAGTAIFFGLVCGIPAVRGMHAQAAAATHAAVKPAQGVAGQLPAFDVVSIKPYGRSDFRTSIATMPDGVEIRGMPMHMLLREAFGVTNDRLLEEPGWVNVERYDLNAKVAPDDAPKFNLLTLQQQWAMFLPVLEDRCALKYHHETRQLTTYVLVVAKGGPKLQPSQPVHDGAKQATAQSPSSYGFGMSDRRFTISGHRVSTASIARAISLQMGSTVIDKTGLTGDYDYSLSWAPDENMKAGNLPPGSSDGAPPPEADGPSIFAAVQEQLGLKLEARKEPVDVIVIDRMEHPTPN